MNVTFTNKDKVAFKEIAISEVFVCKDENNLPTAYLRFEEYSNNDVTRDDDGDFPFNAVNLHLGTLEYFADGCLVVRVDGNLIISALSNE